MIKGLLPLFCFCIDPISALPNKSKYVNNPNIDVSDEEILNDYIKHKFHNLDFNETLSITQKNKLSESILNSRVKYKDDQYRNEIYQQTYKEILNNHPSIRAAIIQNLSSYLYVTNYLNLKKLEIRIEPLDNDQKDIRVINNLNKLIPIDEREAHKIIEKSLLGVAGKNIKISNMKEFNAITSFRENEVPMFEDNLVSLVDRYTSDTSIINNFKKIMEIKKFPDFSYELEHNSMNIDSLYNIRESKEFEEFRNWIRSQDDITEADLKDIFNTFSQRLFRKYNSNPGTAIKLLITAGAGFIDSLSTPIIGTGLILLDNFLQNHILNKNGPLIFIEDKIPTLFNKKNN